MSYCAPKWRSDKKNVSGFREPVGKSNVGVDVDEWMP
jgi:hypothetical protein